MLPQENLEICPYSKGLFGSTSKPNWVSGDQLISAEIFLLVIALATLGLWSAKIRVFIKQFLAEFLNCPFVWCRHLQADGWKIVSAADDKTLKVKFTFYSLN